MTDPALVAMRDPDQSVAARMKRDNEKKAMEDRIVKLERAIDHLCEGETHRAWRIMRGMD